MRTKHSRAFTLIELLLVAGVISILMSVIFFRVTEAKKKAEDAHMVAETAQVSRAIYQYKEDNGGFVPRSLTVTSGTILERNPGEAGPNQDYVEAFEPLVTGGYLPSIPYSPSGEDYAYILGTDGMSAVFAADLNYQKSNSSASNSCPMNQATSTQVDMSSCTTGKTFMRNGFSFFFGDTPSCQAALYDRTTHTCFEYEYPTPCQVCPIVQANLICDGSSNSDYCSCL